MGSKKAAPISCSAPCLRKLPSSSCSCGPCTSACSSACSSTCSSAVLPACSCSYQLLPAPGTHVPGRLQPEGLRLHSAHLLRPGTGNIIQLRGPVLGQRQYT